MDKKNYLKPIILFLAGLIAGILIFQFTPLKDFFIVELEQLPTPSAIPLNEENTKMTCQNQKEEKLVEVDISNQKLRMCEDGKVVKELSISSGKPESPTPTGSFRVINKSLMIYSKIANCWLPFWVGFTQDGQYGFHEIPICEAEGGRTDLDKVGQPVSLGCVRLDVEDSEAFYKWAEIKMPVIIY